MAGANTAGSASTSAQLQSNDHGLAILREAAQKGLESQRQGEAANARRGALARAEEQSRWPLLRTLPMRLSVAIPLPRLRVRDLLALECGQSFATEWAVTDDLPLSAGGVQVAWTEFEVVDRCLAIRLTRLL